MLLAGVSEQGVNKVLTRATSPEMKGSKGKAVSRDRSWFRPEYSVFPAQPRAGQAALLGAEDQLRLHTDVHDHVSLLSGF